MVKSTHIFYYSRQKLGMYLVFNVLLLILAIAFTLTIFPDYFGVYVFAVGSCVISAMTALVVFIVPLRMAVITPEDIKIDRCAPLEWENIRQIKKVKISHGIFGKTILRLETQKLQNYRMNFMQKLICDSKFGAFSIPLYAMSAGDALEIERLIRKNHAAVKPKKKKHPKD